MRRPPLLAPPSPRYGLAGGLRPRNPLAKGCARHTLTCRGPPIELRPSAVALETRWERRLHQRASFLCPMEETGTRGNEEDRGHRRLMMPGGNNATLLPSATTFASCPALPTQRLGGEDVSRSTRQSIGARRLLRSQLAAAPGVTHRITRRRGREGRPPPYDWLSQLSVPALSRGGGGEGGDGPREAAGASRGSRRCARDGAGGRWCGGRGCVRWSRRAWFGGFARWAGGKRGLWDQEELRRRRAEQRKERSEGTCWVFYNSREQVQMSNVKKKTEEMNTSIK
ncbi:uncharacterized protein LOC109367243 isoform X2 [Meleagris gallopavo]|uniref:uncharacterized protein LOC109367243 isoform X2 n=1 Tax=Meleagris gallopavo TaxID=9103 RepID=UPI0012AB3544|nr:uncharacterized protein LOC109367243 isoform X2 [Meleagris gallopavo]